MTHAMIAHADLDTLFAAGLLCEVCEERPWTQRAFMCDALVCAVCAEGEPTPDEAATITLTTDPATALALWEANEAATIMTDGTQYAIGCDLPAITYWQEPWRQTCPEELEALLAQGQ